jgi:hypothetical protein
LVSIFVISHKNFSKQLGKRFEFVRKNLIGEPANPLILDILQEYHRPAGQEHSFWHQSDLCMGLYKQLYKNCLTQDRFIEIVDKVIELKSKNQDTKELENKIDKMVYELYNLSKRR